MYAKNKGFEYEKIAKKYLVDKKYKILEENFISRYGEIDIIAFRDNRLHFIEVKGRKTSNMVIPKKQ